MHKAGVVFAQNQSRQCATHHGHQRVDRHEARNFVQGLGAHHVEAKPAHDQDPRAQGQKRNARRGMCRNFAVFTVTVVTRTQQNDRRQSDPAAHGVDHHRARKVMELIARERLDPGLHAKVLVPDNALKEGVDKAHDHCCGDQLWPELGPLGNAPRNDGGYGGGKGQ